MKKSIQILGVSFLLLVLAACGAGDGDALSEEELSIGVTAGPHEEVMEKVAELAEEQEDLTINVEVFTEYVMPNQALDEGELDMNSYQHEPFLIDFIEDRGMDLVDVATTINFPMGVYSTSIDDVSELEEGDTLGLPNDPTNGARALMLFEDAGLITLDEEAGTQATVLDIVDNPLDLEFVELEASQIPRQLEELDAATINTNFAIEHGYVPTEDSIFIEPGDSPWVNLLVVREENQDDPVVQTVIDLYQSEEVKQFIEDEFAGSIVPSW
ncbi:D-methionine transport system substrate-binding protein [Pelagirhabdus alkalitolerans]|uniref:Lipoprotein n=1 Tax=Pelagirhabdus alkalitolerans TaxID=1612202 RepID=A0A1G6GM44_9BACI|nr:MetQ/NlpA family ABC transporter substrate-binding protein [Pelagirhabdus alkalitolerans]SDB83088.1 D-methionine transport system substrate-binding protein [Pelagirhabdus alkalitolerans]